MESLVVDFLWGYNPEGKKMHMLNKNRIFSPKTKGGLGFRHLSLVNDSLLVKQGWKWIDNPSSLSSAWFLNKYKVPNTEFNFRKTTQDTWSWRGIRNSLPLIEDHLAWRVGNGESINVESKYWKIPWQGHLIEDGNWNFLKLEEC